MGSRTGTATTINGSAGSGSTSVTVPTDATCVVAFWSHWDGDGGSTMSSLTLNGASFAIPSQLAEGATAQEAGVGVAVLESPATGSQTFAWNWSAGGARTEGGEIGLVWVKDVYRGNLVRAAATDAATGGADVSVSLATEIDDLLLVFAMSFTPTNPTLGGSVFIDNASLNSHLYDLSEMAPNATSTTVTMSGGSFPTLAAIALRNMLGMVGTPVYTEFPKPKLAT